MSPFKRRKSFFTQKTVGQKNKKRRGRGLTEYGRQMREKQMLKAIYHTRERQFSNYVKEAMAHRGKGVDIILLFLQTLEQRLDNVVFRLGFAATRLQARQMVTHGHFLVKGRRVDIPSYQTKKDDIIELRPASAQKKVFKDAAERLKKHKPPSWLSLDPVKMSGRIVGKPTFQEAAPPAEIPLIFEFYSR